MNDFMPNKKTVVHTYKNTSFDDWKILVYEMLNERGFSIMNAHPLKLLHGWEDGDTPYGWTDFFIRQQASQYRTMQMKRDNPDKK